MFDKELAQKAIDFFPKYLVHIKTKKWNNVPFELLPWQAEPTGRIFGTLKEDGSRQYNTVYVEVPKKQGKSEWAAGIALKLLFADGEPDAEIYGAAYDREQANIVFDIAVKMIKRNKKLGEKCKLLESTKRIIHNNGSFYRVLSKEAGYASHGYNIHGLIFDELHVQKDRMMYDTLTEMAGDARSQPLTFIITTAGYDMSSICYEVHEYALKVLNDPSIDPTFLPIIYAADPNDDWQDEKVWAKCNPSLNVTIDIAKVRTACKAAQETPAKENNFKRLRLNIWTEARTRWITSDKWKRCNVDKIDIEKLKGRKCYGGLDLSTILDISAWTLCFPPEEEGEKYQFLHNFFIPKANMTERERKDKVSYTSWIKKGLITATEGDVIDYSFIEDQILKDSEKYEIQEIGLDPYNARPTITKMTDAGLTMIELRQGYLTMSPMAKDFEVKVLNAELSMGNNPVMKWMVSCTEITSDPAGNIKPVKPERDRSGKRIDGVISSIMALDRAVKGAKKDSVYKTRGIIAI